MPTCVVCASPLGAPIYTSDTGTSVTSLAQLVDGNTEVFVCDTCGHGYTTPLEELSTYYATDYNILTASEDEDDLYVLPSGDTIYRALHQAQTLEALLPLPQGAAVLDFGCGKAASLRHLAGSRPDLALHVFDVSDNYTQFWDAFIPSERQANFETPASWAGAMDVVTSFFALEHVADPIAFTTSIHALLKPGGTFYCVVPNVFANVGDLMVVDHVHHFGAPSLRRLFADGGFEVQRVDVESQIGAFIVVATALDTPNLALRPSAAEATKAADTIRDIAAGWQTSHDKIQAFTHALAPDTCAAIFGAGLYGLFIAARLPRRDHLRCFIDSNPHKHGTELFGVTVVPPTGIPDDVEAVYIGLNPARARAIIAGIPPVAAVKQHLYL